MIQQWFFMEISVAIKDILIYCFFELNMNFILIQFIIHILLF